jgi:hypothetical protein
MRVGLCTHYARCDQAYLAARLAQLLQTRGIDFDIYSVNQPGKLGLPYDKNVITRGVLRFTEWVRQQNVIVWTHVPNLAQLNYAKRKGAKTIIVPMWQELVPPFKKTLQRADHVITMSAECQMLFSEIYKIRSAELVPFDPGLPIFKKSRDINSRNVRIFLPWFDRNAKCTTGGFISALKFLLEHMEEAYFTLAITPSQFSPAVVKFFLTLKRHCKNRVNIIRSVPVSARPQIYMANDLTLLPAECDNYGLCAITSISVGTPVLTTAISPQTDFLFPDVNSVLVKTAVDYDENGVIHALPDYAKFMYVLQELIAEPGHIQHLNQKTNYNLHARKNAFETVWLNLFNV